MGHGHGAWCMDMGYKIYFSTSLIFLIFTYSYLGIILI